MSSELRISLQQAPALRPTYVKSQPKISFKTSFSEIGAQIWENMTRDQNAVSFERNNGS